MRSRTVARLYPNGLDPETGEYLLPPLDLCGCERIQPALAIRGGPISGVEESRLECAGWAVVFAEDASEDVRRALEPLLALRRGQVGPSERFQLFEGDRAFRRGESKRAWQERIGFGDGPADPDQLPCHLLLVGDPVAIPFEAQFELGIQRSVGRLWFDRPCEFRSYAERVVQAEGRTASERRELALFATANPRDCATEMACEDLMEPLARSLSQAPLGWQLRAFTREAATKERLAALLSGQVPLSLLVTTSHGLGPGAGRPPGEVGALVCQDWPGPGSGPLEPRQVFTAADLRATRADLSGLICYHFGCFSGGLPAEDGFALPGQARQRLAECPRLASLPQAELAQGALAVVAHVDRAWGFSFLDARDRRQPQTLRSVIEDLMRGVRVGIAARRFQDKLAEIQPRLLETLAGSPGTRSEPPESFVVDWLAAMDARGYLVLGDPAARLPGPGPLRLRGGAVGV